MSSAEKGDSGAGDCWIAGAAGCDGANDFNFIAIIAKPDFIN